MRLRCAKESLVLCRVQSLGFVMKNKNRPKAPPPGNSPPPSPPPRETRTENAATPAPNSKSGGLTIFLALAVGVLCGALVMALRGSSGDSEDAVKKMATELRAEVVRTAERRAERLYLARESSATGALRDLAEILDDHLQHGFGGATELRRKLIVTHGRLALLARDLGEKEEVRRRVATAVAIAAAIGEGRVTGEESLFAFIGDVDSGKLSGSQPSSVNSSALTAAGIISSTPPTRFSAPRLPEPKSKGNLVFADATARADVGVDDVFDYGAGDFTWAGFFQSITPPYDHHVLITGHPENPLFYADFADNSLRIALGGVGSSKNLLIPFKADIFDGNWHSFVITRESGVIRAFLDGALIGAGKREGAGGVNHGWTFGHLNQDNDAQTLIGSIKNFSYWNRALTPREAGELAKGKILQGNEPGLVAYWPLDDGDGATFREIVAGRNGNLRGNFKWDRDADRDAKLARQLAERLRPFNDAYAAWHKKVEELRGEPIVTFVELPEYRAIVALGAPALDGLQRKLAENKGLDFLLADAAIEIAGWNREQFPATDLKERSRMVLERLKKFPKHQHR